MTSVNALPIWGDDSIFSDAPLLETSIVSTRACEPCGFFYERRKEIQALLDRGLLDGSSSQKHKDPNSDASGSSPTANRAARGDSKKVVKLSEEDLQVDWYDMLKLANAEGSTEDQVRAAYRKRCLETHPDKQADKSDELFKQVQRAFEILGDPDARRAYDSSRPFDDAIPGDDVKEELFYTTFAPVFERNKKWSVHTVPSIGDENTSIKQVLKFYDAWMQFHSWRDFSHELELEEIDDSMCREEKRFYQRENERQLNIMRRQEQKRVRTLVERAMANDPRLRKKREEDEAKRAAERAERDADKRRLREEEERRRAEIAEKDRLAQEERHQKVVAAKNAIKQSSQQVTDFLKDNNLLDTVQTNMLLPALVRAPNIQWYFSKATVEEAAEMEAAVKSASPKLDADSKSVPAVMAFNKIVEEKEQRLGVTRYGEPVKKSAPPAAASAAANETPLKKSTKSAAVWSDDDLVLLQKAIAKFPGGTVDRWRRIAVMMREKFSEEDVLVKTKEMESALRTGTAPSKPVTAAASQPPSSPEGAAVPTAAAPAAATVEDWTPKQQKQLEQGLRDLKDYKEKDKFQKVSAVVDGKTAKQCFDRYKYLCSLAKK